MKRTPLYPAQLELGAKMVEFGGWEMPVQYTTILEEHRAVRQRAGLFDVSHMGDLLIQGGGAGTSLRTLLTNDIVGLGVGRGIYSHILADDGGIIDDAIVFSLSDNEYLMVPNASHLLQVREWVRSHIHRAEVVDLSDELACLALQGPRAQEVLQSISDMDLRAIKRLRGVVTDLRVPGSPGHPLPGVDETSSEGGVRCFISRSGYTGEDGFEIIVGNEAAVETWNALMTAGEGAGLAPCGLGARDLLRLEMGYLLSGTDFDGSQTPLQTGPEWVIKWDHEFYGRDALVRQRERGGYRKLVGLSLSGRGIPRYGYRVELNGREVGSVTSGTLSPILGRGIALAYVDHELAILGTELVVRIRDIKVPATVVQPPFIRKVNG